MISFFFSLDRKITFFLYTLIWGEEEVILKIVIASFIIK